MNHIRNIYFRGSLRSCNYQCSYCSFGRKTTAADNGRDEQAHRAFYKHIFPWVHPLRIMLIPYGEGLIHAYYQKSMIRLALLPHVEGISCQTNLSFSPQSFIKRIQEHKAEVSKIKLWASFHPEMVEMDVFTDKVHYLYNSGVEVCVGVVGAGHTKNIISALREKLDKRIYLFINAIQGKSGALDDETVSFFTSIDPLFPYDYKNAKADFSRCSGGKETIYVDPSGNVYPCPRNKEPICQKERCDCYIAYSNLKDTPLSKMMGKGLLWRIPEKQKIEAIFFDIDGTLTDATGQVQEVYKEALMLLSASIPLYLATALPLLSAKRRLGNLFGLFAGGVFADGAHLRYNQKDEYIPLLPLPDIHNKGCDVKEYIAGEYIYKYVLKAPSIHHIQNIKEELKDKNYNLHGRRVFLTIVDKKAGKKSGVEAICQRENLNPENVAAIGNTKHDIPMLSAVGYPCAVIDAEDALKQAADYILNPNHLPAFFAVKKMLPSHSLL